MILGKGSDYMNALATAPGVISMPIRVYVEIEDVMVLLGCKKSKAGDYIKIINNKVKEDGGMPFPAGKANKYLFSEMSKLPIEDINKVLEENDRKE